MKIGILAPGITPDALLDQYGSYADMCRNLLLVSGANVEYRVYQVFEGELPEDHLECDAWLITGSKYSAYDDLPWIPPLKQLVREIHAAGQPLAGICFGHQLMAEALGGKVEKYAGGWGVGIHEYDLTATARDELGVSSLHLNAVHQDQVVTLPPGAEVLASSPFCQYAVLRYAPNMVSLQAHPEFSMAFESDLLKLRRGEAVPEPAASMGLQSLEAEAARTDSQQVGAWLVKTLCESA
ncbi:type 1 glutamine amidotransferase [Parathalassolituus penaei]|uniref:Type 1 glutamine amidotransferase n=1 Tax=Parathalassolituus penaei TaxID=2997323 RepID=A0A9X3IUQ9_9GAMM|nr:type 1 glutamine amidotransferase [Parathalassolituus penaei]MCY0967209.1 type 1 glutamine amidotransferase [Parathalassolituus penaei]